MKKLNVAIIVLFCLFISICINIPSLTYNQPILLSVTEYKIEEYREKVIDPIQIEYTEEKQEVNQNELYSEINTPNLEKLVKDNNLVPALDGKVGNVGRLIIPQVNVSVALYKSILETAEDAQNIVNAYDSACYVSYTGWTTYIGDHFFDGFVNMKNSIPGVTNAYIYWTDGTVSKYRCVSKHYNGVNRGNIYDDNGTDIYLSGYDIAMVTCNGYNSNTVTITYWNKE